MKKSLLLFLAVAFFSNLGMAQVIYDFEDASTSTDFQYFGSSLEAQLTSVIDNPNATGINESAKVVEYVKPAGAQTWAGAFSNPAPTSPIVATGGGQICIDVHMDHIGVVAIKLEGGTVGDANWINSASNTVMNEWEQICLDLTNTSLEDNMETGEDTYTNIVVFFDFGTDGGADDVTSYFDNITYKPAMSCTVVYDFEAGGASTTFQYFGSSLEPQLASTIANPNPTGINTTDSVVQYVKAANSQTWAGAFTNPAPPSPIIANAGTTICVDVHFDHIGNLALKLEGAATGDPNWILSVPNTKVNEWEELCFDLAMNSLEDNMEPATGKTFGGNMVLFFDFGSTDTTDVTTYFDNIEVCESGTVEKVDVTFNVDMTGWANVQGVHVRGSFNNWSEDNPMMDMGNGLWSATVPLDPGAYEYKYWIQNGDIWEEFTGLETCVTPPGAYVNRVLAVSSSTAALDTICFESCYACGDEVKINIELAFGDVTPSPDGVWIAGGGNFEAPGGRYKMDDSDGDGIYTISFPRQKGFFSYYTFANGNCPDYSCKEDIAGQSCADPGNFNDRQMTADGDLTISTCFGECTDNTNCAVATRDLTVDNSLFSVSPNPTEQFTLLQFNNRSGEAIQLSLFNTLGQRLLSTELEGWTNNYQLDMDKLNSGIYWIHVQVGKTIANQKIVKR